MLIRKHQYLLTTIKSFIVTHNLSIHIYSLQINGGHFVDPFGSKYVSVSPYIISYCNRMGT